MRDSTGWAGMLPCLLPAYRITQIPRRGDGPAAELGQQAEASDPGLAQRVAALVAAYHAGVADGAAADGVVAFGWVRLTAGGPVRVVAAGDALAGSPLTGEDVLLSLPGGARAALLPPGKLAELLGRLPAWREIAGISDGLLAPAEERRRGGRTTGRATLSLDEGLLGSWNGPFGWIVIAAPLRPADLRSLAAEVGRRQRLAEGAADRFPERAAEAERLRDRHAEAERGASTGFWRIRVLAGGCDAASAARVAGLFCASAGLDGLPYALSPVAPGGRPVDQAGMPGGDATPASPFCGSTELLAALARPPDREVPGIRLALRPDFDVTPEAAPGSPRSAEADGSIPLGEVLDRNMMPAGVFRLSRDSLNRHVFVCGATGAGKSQTVRSLLEAATGQHIPWLVIEPAKAEYRLMASRLPGTEVIRIRPGEPDAVAAGLNPLEPAADASGHRFPLQTHADLVRALFIAAFRSEEPFPQVLSAALTRAYEEAGWDLALGEPSAGEPAYPTLTALQRAAERVVTEIGYSQRITDDVLGFIRVRLASLRLGTTGRFLEGGHPIDFGALLRKNAVLEIEDVGDDADKAFLMGIVLIRLAEHLRLAHRTGPAVTGLRHLTVVEEAHRLLRRPEPDGQSGAGAAGHAVEMFAGLLAEIRAYGEGLVIAEQIPARLVPDAIKNTAVKITHRLPAADDRDTVGATMNATQSQSRFLVTLAPGQAAVFRDGMDFPVLVKMKDGSEREMVTAGATLDARTVVTPRSATCGAECAARPCTLRDMRAAQRALGDFPWARLWAELAVLAHLTGWPVPVPKPVVLARFRELAPRVSQCATAHAVDAAVAARPSVRRPGALARHAQAAIRARADHDQWLCPADEPEWLLAGPVTEAVAFGAARPSAIESAGPLTPLLGEFIDCRWPLQYLNPARDQLSTELRTVVRTRLSTVAGSGLRLQDRRPDVRSRLRRR
ncbi:MAG TPA: ATP-binding protein [Streptosporangiaceae bacterium]|nr:ATP-binding protein [Streptosporangiaceae bacterium]